MKTQEKKAKDRKFMVALPLLALPFLTVMFWAMGGGTGVAGEEVNNLQTFLNPDLPSGKADDSPRDKLSYYELAEKDSAELLELIKRDPNYQHDILDSPYTDDPFGNPYGNPYEQHYGRGSGNPTANQIYRGLSDLEREMQQPYGAPGGSYGGNSGYGGYGGYSSYHQPEISSGSSPEIMRLEQMMAELNQPSAPDPEMQQLNSMLDKIMEIQNPELADERLREKSSERRGEVFAVSTNPKGEQVSLLDAQSGSDPDNGFFSLDDGGFSDQVQNAIKAVVHEDQTLVNGSTVKLRLVNDIYINGVRIPKDNFLFGVAQLTGERLTVKIESIRHGQSLFPVDLAVYDLDGMDGVYIPGSITRDVAKQSADRPLQGISLSTLDPSWGAQAAGAGVEVVKGLFSKTAKLIKVKVKAGYQVLLRDGKQKSNEGF